jgi:hypothetical protein
MHPLIFELLAVSQCGGKSPFSGSWIFNTVFIKARYLNLFWTSSVLSMFAQISSKDYFNISSPKGHRTSRVSYHNYVCDSCSLMQATRVTVLISVHSVRLSTSIIVHNFRRKIRSVLYTDPLLVHLILKSLAIMMCVKRLFNLSLPLFPLLLSV